MLEYIRERAQGWVAWTIIGLLIIPFALWGINYYFQGGGDAVVANVNGTDISLREYQELLQQQRDRVRGMLGANANADLIENLVKPSEVLEATIEREVLTQVAKKSGYRVADGLLAEQIKNIEGFQHDGVFSKQLYEQYLRSQGLTSKGFEARFARSLLLDQLNSGVMDTAIVTTNDVNSYIRLRDQKREFGYMTIPVARFEATVEVDDERIKNYYEQNKERFTQPEEASVEYVELNAADLAKNVSVKEEELQHYYQEQKEHFGMGEERKARHILIQADPQKDPKGEKALARAQELLDRINKGESFEEIAKKNSDDTGSAASGGELGYFGRGTMDKAFEEAAFALTKGEVSKPVKSAFGYHIIKLEDIRPATQKPFAEVRADVERQVTEKKSETLFYEQSDVMTNTAFEKPDSLQPLADALGLKINTTALFNRRGGAGIAANPKVAAAAFSDDVLNKGLNSEPIEVGPNHLVVIRVKDHKPEAQKSLDEVRPMVTVAVKREAAREKAEQLGKAAESRIQSGEDPVKVAKELNVEWKASVVAGRNEASLDRALVDHVFKLVRPAADKTTTGSLALTSGDYVVVRLASVKDGDPSQIDDAQKKQIQNTLASAAADSDLGAILESIKKHSKIARFEDKL